MCFASSSFLNQRFGQRCSSHHQDICRDDGHVNLKFAINTDLLYVIFNRMQEYSELLTGV